MKNKIMYLIILLVVVSTANASLNNIKDVSISLVNQDPDPAISGETFEIRLGIENRGGQAAENLIIEVLPEYPFELVSGESASQTITKLGSYQYDEDMQVIKFKLRVDREATAATYSLKIKNQEEGGSVTAMRDISIEVKSKESAEVIHIDKTNLIPGKESGLKFTINNVGNAPLRDMTFSWQNEDDIILPVGSDNTRYIKYLDVEENAELEFNVIADTNANPGLYKLDLSLTYEDPITGEDEEISTIAGIYVGGETDFDIAFSESNNGETAFTISNIGSNEAYSVSVIIPQQETWKVSGSNTMIIGNLDKGDYTIASFALNSGGSFDRTAIEGKSREEIMKNRQEMQNSSVKNSGNIKIQIAYTDTMGKRSIVEKEVQVNLQSTTVTGVVPAFNGRAITQQQSLISQYKWWIILSVALVMLFISYNKYKRKKLMDPHFRLFGKKKKR